MLEILSHVNKRVKHHLEIGLPLMDLWNIYSQHNVAPMVRNFCSVYIEMAFERAPAKVCVCFYFCFPVLNVFCC